MSAARPGRSRRVYLPPANENAAREPGDELAADSLAPSGGTVARPVNLLRSAVHGINRDEERTARRGLEEGGDEDGR